MRLPEGPEKKNEIDWITDEWYLPHRISTLIIACCLTWFFVFGVYVLCTSFLTGFGGHPSMTPYSDAFDQFTLIYGIGAILASLVTPLFAFHYLVDEWEEYVQDRGKIRTFLRVRRIRDGRMLLRET